MRGEEGQLRDFLLDSGLVSRTQLEQTLRAARGKPLSHALIEGGILSEDEVRRASAHALGIPFVVLDRDTTEPEALTLIPEPVSRAHGIVAYRVDERGVEVGLLDMTDLSAVDFLKHKYKVLPRLTSRESLKRALLLYQKLLRDKFGTMLERAQGSSALDGLILHAINQSASVVHMEPRETGDYRIRYRVHGVLHEAMALSKKTGGSIIEHIKGLGGGQLRLMVGEKAIKLRVEIMQTVWGEKLALHLSAAPGQYGFTLESLGLHGEALEQMHAALERRTGLLVVSGPPGSGVSTTLYTLLDMLNLPKFSLASVEKKIEYRLPHVAQTLFGGALGLSSAAALRAVLRQDPDVVMLNDTEEEAALELAEEAAKRCLVLLGTQESVEVPRAMLFLRQRLVRTLCKNYRQERLLSRSEGKQFEEAGADFGRVLAALKDEGIVAKNLSWRELAFFAAESCSECAHGYRGHTGLFEVSDPNRRSAGLTLAEEALFKAAAGRTSIEEVLKVV